MGRAKRNPSSAGSCKNEGFRGATLCSILLQQYLNIPRTGTPGKPGFYAAWMPSFLGVLNASTQAGGFAQAGESAQTGVVWTQYVATGKAATMLASRPQISILYYDKRRRLLWLPRLEPSMRMIRRSPVSTNGLKQIIIILVSSRGGGQ